MPNGSAGRVDGLSGSGSDKQAGRQTWAALLHAAHSAHADERAVRLDDGWLSYRELFAASAKVAAWLSSREVGFGARIILALDNCPEMVVIERALALWGWVRVAVSPRLHPEEIEFMLADCGASAIFCEARISKLLKTDALVIGKESGGDDAFPLSEVMGCASEVPDCPEIVPEDLASLMYTSGTTGRPKAAMNTHRAWHAMATNMQRILPPIGPGDILLHVAPMSHFSGSVASAYAASGATIATVAKFDAAKVLEQAAKIRASCLPLVPTMLNDILQTAGEGAKIPSLKVVPYGGSSIAVATLIRARETLGDVLLQVYGMSEALIPVSSLSPADHCAGPEEDLRLRSAGKVSSDVEVRLGNEADGIGEIQVRGANVMAGYWNNQPQTLEVLDADGWYSTGDLGTFNDSFLEIVGRSRDLIISGGFNVYPAEVERVIQQMDEVGDVAVVGLPDARWGEVICAMIALRPGTATTLEAVVSTCRQHLASYKKPSRVEFVDVLPRTSTGKIDKNRIRKMLSAQ